MERLNEIRDMSKRVLEIDIESPVFNSLLNSLNAAIQKVVKNVYDEKFISGEITLKLNTEIINSIKETQRVDEFGEIVNESYRYRSPKFDYKITTQFKKQYKDEGCYLENKEIVFDGEKFMVKPLVDNQINIYDMLDN